MKHYVYLLLISLLLLSCSSNRSLDSSKNAQILASVSESEVSKSEKNAIIQEESTTTTKGTSNTQEKTNEIANDNKESNEFTEEYELHTIYDDQGNIREQTERGKRSGRAESTTSRTGSSHASNQSNEITSLVDEKLDIEINSQSESETNLDIAIDINQQENINEKNDTDSRPVKGVEWLYVILPIAIIVGIVYLIRNGRKKHSK